MKQPPLYSNTLAGILCKVTTSKHYLVVDITIDDNGVETQAGFPIPIEVIRDAIQGRG